MKMSGRSRNGAHRNNDETAGSHLSLLCHYLSSQKVPWGILGFVSAEAGSNVSCLAATTLPVWAQCGRTEARAQGPV